MDGKKMNEKKIKVAQVIGMAINGGTESLWMNYYRNIDRSKIQFDFLVESTSDIIDKDEIESLGGNVVFIPSYKNPIKYIKTLKKIFKQNNYDIVHSNMNSLSLFTLKAAKKAGIKVRIAHSHSTSNKKEWKKNILKNILRPFSKKYATHYFACSELAGRWLFGNKTYDDGKVNIITNAIDYDRFKFNKEVRTEIRGKLGIKNDEFVLGNVGRFMPQKNQLFLIDIFKQYHDSNNKSKLLLIGDGPLKEQLKDKIKKYNLEDSVIFGGVHQDVEKYYNAMDIFVFPSLYEGLGMCAVEAQINGLPTIVSDNLPSSVKINDNIYFCPLDSVDSWLKNIRFNDLDRCSVKISDKYDIKNEAIIMGEIYETILNIK